jgi:carboxylesterase
VTQRVIPGAEPFRYDAGPVGALLIHGFTGCPASMRPMGEWLSQHGISTVGPRLPGHGTSWEDLERTTWRDWEAEAEAALAELAGRCSSLVVVGLSMGGCMALHMGAKHGGSLKGVVCVNPDIRRPELALAGFIRLFTRSTKGVGNDIKKPGQDEIVYQRVPLKAAAELGRFYRATQKELPSMSLPLLVFSSAEDHVVKPASSRFVIEHAGSAHKELVPLTNSYHVATLDYDAELIFERTLRFATAAAAGG